MPSQEVDIETAMKRADKALGESDIAEHQKINRAGTTKAELMTTSGATLTDRGNDKWKVSYDLRTEEGKRGFRQALEAMNPSMRLADERGAKVSAQVSTTRLVDRATGQTKDVPDNIAAFVARRRGMVERMKYRATQRYVMGIGWVKLG